MERVIRRYIVRGRVQGVGFRYFTERLGRNLGLDGWVRNLPDGRSVEAVAAGDPATLDDFERGLREGPPGSFVAEFEQFAGENTPGDGFHVVP
ncbi:MAG: acylphosphatase [Dehalococcoidia bacterium]|nr:acylphosphatase [Dehalococcoidia bacterium]